MVKKSDPMDLSIFFYNVPIRYVYIQYTYAAMQQLRAWRIRLWWYIQKRVRIFIQWSCLEKRGMHTSRFTSDSAATEYLLRVQLWGRKNRYSVCGISKHDRSNEIIYDLISFTKFGASVSIPLGWHIYLCGLRYLNNIRYLRLMNIPEELYQGSCKFFQSENKICSAKFIPFSHNAPIVLALAPSFF